MGLGIFLIFTGLLVDTAFVRLFYFLYTLLKPGKNWALQGYAPLLLLTLYLWDTPQMWDPPMYDPNMWLRECRDMPRSTELSVAYLFASILLSSKKKVVCQVNYMFESMTIIKPHYMVILVI